MSNTKKKYGVRISVLEYGYYRYFIGNDLDCFRKYCEADDILARVRELIRENESQFEV